jgi:uncharacterized protein YbgA (DUF1722 family)
MGDLLEKVKELAFDDFSRELADKLFPWKVKDITVRSAANDETHVSVFFDNDLVLHIKYFLNLDPTEMQDICEFVLALRTDLRSRIRYDMHYAGYIHGQGYIRLKIQETDNRILQRMLEEFYVPALKRIYKPIIIEFKGFYAKDYFGALADSSHGEIYYSPVRFRSEHKNARVWDVLARLQQLEALLKETQIRHSLAELDLQMSFLPDVMWSSI